MRKNLVRFGVFVVAILLVCSVFLNILLMSRPPTRKEGARLPQALFKKEVQIVRLEGVIDYGIVHELTSTLRDAAEDDSVKAVVLWIDSPGGSAGACQEIVSEIRKLSAQKPVVAYVGGIAASGGYYVATACDKIVADPLAILGNIGVSYVHYDLSVHYDKEGIKVYVIKTGPYKDIGTEYRPLTEKEKEMMKEIVYAYFDQFLDDIALGRDLDKDYVEQYADGRLFMAEKALSIGFIDDTGDLDDAVDLAAALAKIKKPKVEIIKPTTTSQEFIGEKTQFRFFGDILYQ